jgi:spore germination protein KC
MLIIANTESLPETDMLTYVMLVGIDEGETLPYRLTFQYAMLDTPSGGTSTVENEKDEKPGVLTVEAWNLWSALQISNAFTSRDLTLKHNRAFIISEAAARRGIGPLMEMLTWDTNIRRECYLLLTPGNAGDFIKSNNANHMEKYPARHFEFLMKGNMKTGMSLISDIHSVYNRLKSSKAQAAMGLVNVNDGRQIASVNRDAGDFNYFAGKIPREAANQTETMGMAVFFEDKPVGYLNGGECQYFNLITGAFKSGIMRFENISKKKEAELVLLAKPSGFPTVRVQFQDGKAYISVKIRLKCLAESFDGPENLGDPKETAQIEAVISEKISREMTKMARKVQKEMRSDIFGFCDYARAHFFTLKAWEDHDWQTAFEEGQIQISAAVSIGPANKLRMLERKKSMPGQ